MELPDQPALAPAGQVGLDVQQGGVLQLSLVVLQGEQEEKELGDGETWLALVPRMPSHMNQLTSGWAFSRQGFTFSSLPSFTCSQTLSPLLPLLHLYADLLLVLLLGPHLLVLLLLLLLPAAALLAVLAAAARISALAPAELARMSPGPCLTS